MAQTNECADAVDAAIAEIEALDDARRALDARQPRKAAKSLEAARRISIDSAPPVPIARAGDLLDVSQPTIRQWADLGILEDVAGRRPRAVTVESVIAVRALLDEIRELGRGIAVRQALLDRIDDQMTLSDPQLRRSIRQMRSGKKKHIVHGR